MPIENAASAHLFLPVPSRSQRNATIPPMASDDLKRLVATEVALGASTGELAERHGYTSRGMRKLVHSPGVQRLVAEERQALAEQVDRYRADLVGMGDLAVERVRSVLEDPRHPRAVETARWLLDKVAFGRTEVAPSEPALSVTLSNEALAFLNEKLPSLAASLAEEVPVNIEDDPRLFRPPQQR